MSILFLGGLTSAMLGWLMGITSIFLIMLILVQRGRGGGLAGALGGPGGQSAFGSKAGDTFTTITIGLAIFWGLVCAITILVLSPEVADIDEDVDGNTSVVSAPGEEAEGAGSLPDLGAGELSDGLSELSVDDQPADTAPDAEENADAAPSDEPAASDDSATGASESDGADAGSNEEPAAE